MKEKSNSFSNREHNIMEKAKKKKKRKNDSSSENMAPKKKTKVANKIIENEDANCEEKELQSCSDNEEINYIELSKEDSDKINGKIVRELFKSGNGIRVLQKFIKICKHDKKKDLAAEYLQAGGSVIEILKLLDKSEKKNVSDVSTVFSSMTVVIMKILEKFPQNQAAAEEACRYFINSHLASIHTMLSSQSSAKHRKIVLQLLSAVVSLKGTLPRELLNHLSLHSQLVEALISHSNPLDPENVRTCFIHFLLAFLIDGIPSDLRALLEKRGVLSSIFAEMIYDDCTVVQLVLKTIKKYILENPSITKTIKLHLFTTPVIQSIVNLYNWKGPKKWRGHKRQKVLVEDMADHVDTEEKEHTLNVVHEFLITLLTSNRHGIAFNIRSLEYASSGKRNQFISIVLQSLDKPWEHEKPSELVVKILSACPDLIQSQFISAGPFLEPRVSMKWMSVMEFIKNIIMNVDTDSCLKLSTADTLPMQTTNAVINILLSPIVFKNAIAAGLKHNNPIVHHEIVKFCLVVIKKLDKFLKTINQLKFKPQEKDAIKNLVFENIVKHMPSFESILDVWSKAFSPDSEISDTDENLTLNIKNHLLTILDMLQAYVEICPEILLMSNVKRTKQSTVLLTLLCDISNVNEDELTVLKVKALKVLLHSNISDFSPTSDIFNNALTFLFTKVGGANASFDKEICQCLNLLLNECGAFEGCNDQIDIWIDSIKKFESIDEKYEIADWLAVVIKNISEHTDKYISIGRKAEEKSEEEVIDSAKQEDIFDELSEQNIEDVKLSSGMLLATSIPLLLYGTIERLEKSHSNVLNRFMSFVLTHTLHSQVSPKPLILAVKNLNLPNQKYLKSCLKNEKAFILNKPFSSTSIFRQISEILISFSNSSDFSVEGINLMIKKDDVSTYNLTHFEIKYVVRMVMFYITRSIRKFEGGLPNMEVYVNLLSCLLRVAKENDSGINLLDECSRWILKNPIFLQYFNGICETENDTTMLFQSFCNILSKLEMTAIISVLMAPYQNKFIVQIKYAIEKYKKNKLKQDFKYCSGLINCLQLDAAMTVKLINTILTLPKSAFLSKDKSTLSTWSVLLSQLIKQLVFVHPENEHVDCIVLQENAFKKVVYLLVELMNRNQKVDLWVDVLWEYLVRFSDSVFFVEERLFVSLLKSCETAAVVKLLTLLVQKNNKLIGPFMAFINANDKLYSQKELIFSIISSNLKHKWDQDFLDTLCKRYTNDIIDFATEPSLETHIWIQENIQAVEYLIDKTFDPEVCKKICNSILSSGDKLYIVQEFHIKIFHKLFQKCLSINPNALKDFCQVVLHILVDILKKDGKNVARLNYFCNIMIQTINSLKTKNNFTFEELSKNNSWSQFTRISLKSALKMGNNKQDNTSLLLKAMTAACDSAYANGCGDEYVKTIFEMTTSHSEFVKIMLGNSNLKDDLTKLLWVLINKNLTVMAKSQIPLYLASYNATLSVSDQYLIKILQFYETNEVKLNSYKPYMWGDAAATHYSVKGEIDTALFREPSTSQIFDLLVPEIVYNTVQNYPIDRNWKGDILSSVNDLSQIYDPLFYLPVFTQLLAGNNIVACHKVIHSGALALAISACSSTCEQMRMAAFTLISRFYYHLEATNSKEKLLWMHFVNAVRRGITQSESSIEKIRLNGFISTFLARTSLVLTQPLHPLYAPLQDFLMAKPALDLNSIPEFLKLYHSSEIEHRAHRHWILELVRDGIKTDEDVDIALRYMVFKMMLDFYDSALSDMGSKNLILQVIKSATKSSYSCLILVRGYALLPFLINVSESKNAGNEKCDWYLLEIVNNIDACFKQKRLKESLYTTMLERIMSKLQPQSSMKSV